MANIIIALILCAAIIMAVRNIYKTNKKGINCGCCPNQENCSKTVSCDKKTEGTD